MARTHAQAAQLVTSRLQVGKLARQTLPISRGIPIALFARAANRTHERVTSTTADQEVLNRRRLLLDFDPVRPTGISSTDGEHQAAIQRAITCRAVLTEAGFPQPILADSGNGGHLVYSLDLPNDDASRILVEKFLKQMSQRFSDAVVTVDTTVFNAARISKVYGTLTRKGDNLPDRPHRLSRILESPSHLEPVPREMLSSFVPAVQLTPVSPSIDKALLAENKRLNDASAEDSVQWVQRFLDKHNIPCRQVKEDNGKWKQR